MKTDKYDKEKMILYSEYRDLTKNCFLEYQTVSWLQTHTTTLF